MQYFTMKYISIFCLLLGMAWSQQTPTNSTGSSSTSSGASSSTSSGASSSTSTGASSSTSTGASPSSSAGSAGASGGSPGASGGSVPMVNGSWTDWEDLGPCCGGYRRRSRNCTNPPPSGGGNFCAGPSQLVFTCSPDNCVNGGWSEWSDFGPCCGGERHRTRTCLQPNKTACVGASNETATCERDPSECYFPDFETDKCMAQGGGGGNKTNSTSSGSKGNSSSTSSSSSSSSSGSSSNKTTTTTPGKSNTTSTTRATVLEQDPTDLYETSAECCAMHFNSTYDDCLGTKANVVDGGWGNWTEFGQCCYGTQSRFRVCDQPAPMNGGAACPGSFQESRACTEDTCNRAAEQSGAVATTTTAVANVWAMAGLGVVAAATTGAWVG